MNVSQRRSAFEAKVAASHRMAYYAAQQADALGYRGALQDLDRVQLILEDLLENSLSSNPRALDKLRHITDDVPF
jgi:hypothetical protein